MNNTKNIIFTGCLRKDEDLIVNTKNGVNKIDMRSFYISFENDKTLLGKLEWLINNNNLEYLNIVEIK